MKKMVAIILAIAVCVSMLVLPVSAEEQEENVHSSGAGVLTETGNDQLPELDEDLLSILTDIEALVEKYGSDPDATRADVAYFLGKLKEADALV